MLAKMPIDFDLGVEHVVDFVPARTKKCLKDSRKEDTEPGLRP